MRAGALLVIGVWMGLLVASWAMASASFRTVDRLLGPQARPSCRRASRRSPPTIAATVLRHVAAEANRWMFRTWAAMELVPGGGAGRTDAGGSGRRRARSRSAVAAVVVVQSAAIGPAIAHLGRSLDFVPRPLPPADGRRFGLLHAAYMLADVVKAGGLAAAAAIIARRGAVGSRPAPPSTLARDVRGSDCADRRAAGRRSPAPARRPASRARSLGVRMPSASRSRARS